MKGSKQQTQASLARSWDNVGRQTFVPAHYEFSDEKALVHHVSENPVGQLFSAADGNMRISVVPFIWAPRAAGGALRLAGHMAARNPHEAHVVAAGDAAIHFTSPGAYISPRWFRKNNTAATFSYVSAQIRGQLEPIHDPDETLLVLARTVDHMEALTSRHDTGTPWSLDTLSEAQIARYVPMVRAFYLDVHEMEGIARLNQEKERPDMEGILDGLRGQPTPGAQHIAGLMAANLKLMEG